MNNSACFDAYGRPYVTKAEVGDVLILEGFRHNKVTHVYVYSEYDGAYTVNDGCFNYQLPKRLLRTNEVKAALFVENLSSDEPDLELCMELKDEGRRRSFDDDAFIGRYEEKLEYLMEAESFEMDLWEDLEHAAHRKRTHLTYEEIGLTA